jgi:glycosyltransferase involved in cell wall biosynthesis
MAPRPFAPRILTDVIRVGRWDAYASAQFYEVCNGVPVYRPAYLQIPRMGHNLWQEKGLYHCCVGTAKKLHAMHRFDAILCFGLGVSGLGWRLGRDLVVPVAAWSTGSDIRQSKGTGAYIALVGALKKLDLLFYQSQELLQIAVELTGESLPNGDYSKHLVLPRGVSEPPCLDRDKVREQTRNTLGLDAGEVLVLYVGRVTREKGLFELVEAMSLARKQNSQLRCLIVGCKPGFDESNVVARRIVEEANIREHVQLLAACEPKQVWEYLCAADIFAFPSHNEGMPNSLLEAMVMELPSIAFAIPAIRELESGSGGISCVPPFDTALFARAILHLALSEEERLRIGKTGRKQVRDRFMARENMEKAYAQLALMIEGRNRCREPENK